MSWVTPTDVSTARAALVEGDARGATVNLTMTLVIV